MRSQTLPFVIVVVHLAILPLVGPDAQLERRLEVAIPREVSHTPRGDPTSLSPRQIEGLAYQLVLYVGRTIVVWTKCVLAAIAAYTALHRLYTIILERLLDKWAKSPPQNQVVIEAGRLRWEFGCTVNPVPWEYLEEYFRSKQSAVGRGFAEVYAKEWFFANEDNSRHCYAGMRAAREGEDVIPPEIAG